MSAKRKRNPIAVGIAAGLGTTSALGVVMTIGARLVAWEDPSGGRTFESRMAILTAALGVTFAAISLWLAVRVVNRREQWAKWAAAVTLLTVVVYFASYGPWMCVCVWRFESMEYIDGGGFYAAPYWIASLREVPWFLQPYNAYLKWWIMPNLN